MSTRALYTFKAGPDDAGHDWNVYVHYDGYPGNLREGACAKILAALKLAWELPRYESDEFAAAFIAANKSRPGGVRLMPQGNPLEVAVKNCSDIEFRYVVQYVGKGLVLTAYETSIGEAVTERKLFSAPLNEKMVQKALARFEKEGVE